MRLFKHFTESEIKRHFTYRGWFCGLVPIYIGNLHGEAPDLSVRNGIPEIALDIAEGLYATFCLVAGLFGHPIETYSLHVTGRLDGKPITEQELM